MIFNIYQIKQIEIIIVFYTDTSVYFKHSKRKYFSKSFWNRPCI